MSVLGGDLSVRRISVRRISIPRIGHGFHFAELNSPTFSSIRDMVRVRLRLRVRG